MAFQVKIGVTNDGEILLGADDIKYSTKPVVDIEYVYGSQLSHRVAIYDKKKGWFLGTPSQIKGRPWKKGKGIIY